MKGRLKSRLSLMIGVTAVAFLAVLWLAYSAGAKAGGVGILDAPSVSGRAGGLLVIAVALCVMVPVFFMFWLVNRVLEPVKRLGDFAERFSQGDYRARAAIDSSDDFGFVAEHLNRAAESSSRAIYNQERSEERRV